MRLYCRVAPSTTGLGDCSRERKEEGEMVRPIPSMMTARVGMMSFGGYHRNDGGYI